MPSALLADIVLLVHAAFVAFVVGGLVATWIGLALRRPFSLSFALRAAHLGAIAFVVAEAVLGYACPLTLWEDALRGTTPDKGFVARWIHAWLFWTAPPWVFTAAYVAFGLLVAATWWRFPPHRRRRG